ncbi:tubulin-folding cofactor B-like [Brassica napus]|uniref:tubulin-folding cofactor B-like n=1 Tax=Brassica napus TaxID=3708 RepID=UPI002078B79E|nr:tubulin-folding cofactor B-like [Brassica napus]
MAASRLQMEGDDECGRNVGRLLMLYMALELYDESGSKVAALSDDSRPLVDLDPSSVTTGGWLEDTSLVETYNISDKDTMLNELMNEDFMEDLCANIKFGDYPERDPFEEDEI